MSKAIAVPLAIACCVVLSSTSSAQVQPLPESVEQVHQQLLTLDTHIDVPNTLGTGDTDPRRSGPMQVDLPGMRSGGLDAGFFIVYVAQGATTEEGYNAAYVKAQEKFAAIERMLANSPDEIVLVRNPQELRAAHAQGKLIAAIGVENAYPLGPDLEHLDEFYQRGARYVSITHFGHNDFGDSSLAKGEIDGNPEPFSHGLSERGRALIDALNSRGIMVDVSHTGTETTLQTAGYSKAPVIASHSGVKALFDHHRNLSDAEIKAIAANGGVIQVVAFDSYMRDITAPEKAAKSALIAKYGVTSTDLGKLSATEMGALRDEMIAMHDTFPKATISTLADNIDYIVNLVGIEHVGIASDFGGGGGVYGWYDISQTASVTAELISRGYSEPQLQKIWSGNLLRVWEAVEALRSRGHSQ